ncbi:MAG TPA: RlpA-like double-psi beta-barrel domain-containing protein, partial [Candidatus Limnocylindrales bacterium]|nr:RlpA-like double-psi beta-barrel domain-containing protein [Candidatus Limnocylindrales bacterium]
LTVAIVSAAPRPAQTTERVDLSALSSAGPTGAPQPQAGSRRPGPGEAEDAPPGRSAWEPARPPVAVPTSPLIVVTEPPAAGGRASWYDVGPGLYAAVPSWRWGDEPYQVRVATGGRAVVVTVGDFCGCPGARVIDLSADAFRRLAPLSVGLVRVTVTRLGPGVTAPPTETEP